METHLDNSIHSAEIFSSDYTVYRRDRDRNGGGVLVAVKAGIVSSQIDNTDGVGVELMLKIQ